MKITLTSIRLSLGVFAAGWAMSQPAELKAELSAGPSTVVLPYYNGATNVDLVSILTVADTNSITGGYRPVGIMDGIGICEIEPDRFRIFVNHEIRGGGPGGEGGLGVTRAYGGRGAFQSDWWIGTNLAVLSGADLISNYVVWDAAMLSYRAFVPSNDLHISRLCSADNPARSAFYNSMTMLGTTNCIMMAGEEDARTVGSQTVYGAALGTVADGPETGTSYQLPQLGRLAWENLVASPYEQDSTIVAGLDDSSLNDSFVTIYVGTKTSAGNDVERAGLTNGITYGVRVLDEGMILPVEGTNTALGISVRKETNLFELVGQGDLSGDLGDALKTALLGQGPDGTNKQCTAFQRIEDGSWDPRPGHEHEFYFITTGRVGSTATTNPTRIWRLAFNTITNVTAGGVITLVAEGPAGTAYDDRATPVMLDNMVVDRYGRLLATEDPGSNARLPMVWLLDLNESNPQFVAVAECRPEVGLAVFDEIINPSETEFLTQDIESSGIIDATDALGAGWYLFDIQIHTTNGTTPEEVERGQLLALYVPTNTAEIGALPALPNAAPTVSISGLSSSLPEGVMTNINATARDFYGSVSNVSFWANGALLGDDASAPYSVMWMPTNGTYAVVAVAVDTLGLARTSTAVNVSVGGAGTSTAGTTTAGTGTAGDTTAGTTTSGTTTAGTGAGTGGTGGTSAGSTTGPAQTLGWTLSLKKPKTGKPVKFKAGKKGIGTVQGTVEGVTELEKKTEGVQVEYALVTGSTGTNAGTNASTNVTPISYTPFDKIGKVSKKGKVKFKSNKVGSDLDLASGDSFSVLVRATLPGSNFTDIASQTLSNGFQVK